MNTPSAVPLRPALQAYLEARAREENLIPEDRKAQLRTIATYVREERSRGTKVYLLFVCTHNSRRSQMSQAWAKAVAEYLGVSGIETQSAGLEQTAFNPRAVAALLRAGFLLHSQPRPSVSGGPRYGLVYGAAGEKIPSMYSKTLQQALPNEGWDSFAAIMTCSDADEKCPVVPGATVRFRLPYEDPKLSDDTPDETATYDERCAQIAREQLFLFRQVAAG